MLVLLHNENDKDEALATLSSERMIWVILRIILVCQFWSERGVPIFIWVICQFWGELEQKYLNIANWPTGREEKTSTKIAWKKYSQPVIVFISFFFLLKVNPLALTLHYTLNAVPLHICVTSQNLTQNFKFLHGLSKITEQFKRLVRNCVYCQSSKVYCQSWVVS